MWIPIPEDSEWKKCTFQDCPKEQVICPEDGGPDLITTKTLVINGKPTLVEIGLREWVSGWGECYHEYEPICYREVK